MNSYRLSRRTALTAASLGGLSVLTGCAGIPGSSQPSSVPRPSMAVANAPIVEPHPPTAGAGPLEIVSGFLRACTGVHDDFAVARDYLTDSAASQWAPTEECVVHPVQEEPLLTQVGAEEVDLSVWSSARVDSIGTRQQTLDPDTRSVRLRLTEEQGEWRIMNPPNAIIVSETAFDLLFAPITVFFLNPARNALVADQRWFLRNQAARQAITALHAGPAPHLRGAVVSDLSEDLTAELADEEAGESGVLRVSLTSSSGEIDAHRRAHLRTQLEATLLTVPAVTALDVDLEGERLAADPQRDPVHPHEGARALGAGPAGVISLDDDGPPGRSLVPALSSVPVRRPVLSSTGIGAAALTMDRTGLLVTSQDDTIPLREATTGKNLLAPAIDRYGFVWTADADVPGQIRIIRDSIDAAPRIITVPWLQADVQLLAIAVAADGVRVTAVVRQGTRLLLAESAVLREPSSAPKLLTNPLLSELSLEQVSALCWYSDLSMLIVGTEGGQPTAVIWDAVRGAQRVPPLRSGVVTGSGTLESGLILTATEDGAVWQNSGSGWSALDVTARDPGFY